MADRTKICPFLLSMDVSYGMRQSDMAKKYKVARSTIYNNCKKYRIPTRFELQEKLYANGKRMCSSCGKIKFVSEFNKCRLKCKTCKSQIYKSLKLSDDIYTIFGHKFKLLRSNAKKRKILFDLSVNDLIDLWEKQNGICFYTGIKMEFFDPKKRLTVSIDRMDSNKYYTKDNIVMCCTIVNIIKHDLEHNELKFWIRSMLKGMFHE